METKVYGVQNVCQIGSGVLGMDMYVTHQKLKVWIEWVWTMMISVAITHSGWTNPVIFIKKNSYLLLGQGAVVT